MNLILVVNLLKMRLYTIKFLEKLGYGLTETKVYNILIRCRE